MSVNGHHEDSVVISLEESTEIASPYLSSGLLCPSNLGALLESTTATLVSGGWKETSGRNTSTFRLEEGRNGVADAANVNLPEISQLEDVANWQESVLRSSQVPGTLSDGILDTEVYEVTLAKDFQPGNQSKAVSTMNQNPDLPILISPIPLQTQLPTSPSYHPSPLSSPRPSPLSSPLPSPHLSPLSSPHPSPLPSSHLSPLPSSHLSLPPSSHQSPLLLQVGPCMTAGETHTSCYSSDIDLHQQHQLCIPIDEGSAVVYTPPSIFRNQSSCGSHRSSFCSSALNEGEVSGIVRHDIKTHSRNVSETPSLPPFYSSSTSSAYHSRNSSLGSQMSSCFESDSMLNQMTDMDSCLALQTGSNPDLKYVKRMHDSRFSRQGESSPSSCSSDLSLHHHMSKPLDAKVTIVNISSLNLEETLRNLSLDRVEDYKRKLTLKSSEWIKEEMESHKDTLVVVKVSSKSKHVVHYNVKAGDILIWEFATKKKDIAFGVSFEATEVATKLSPLPDSHESLEQKMSAILPIFRVSTQAHPTIGTHTASLDGVYEITFDNMYSRFFAKELYYRITSQPSEPNAHYLEQ